MGIILHPKYGLNPTVINKICFVCGKEVGTAEIALLGSSYKEEAPSHMVMDNCICNECDNYRKQGVWIISVRDGSNGSKPYKTGKVFLLKEEAHERIFGEKPGKEKITFVEDSVLDRLGFFLKGKEG